MLKVKVIPILEDNYVFVIHNKTEAVVVDPGAEQEVNDYLALNKLNLISILNTHHHYDHTDANLPLKQKWKCPVYACELDQKRIPTADIYLKPPLFLKLLGTDVSVLFTPGHTKAHISYYFKKEGFIFCGDTLFNNGCGRVFDSNAEQLFKSLLEFKKLPPSTLIYCTHEYTLANTNFALSVDPTNTQLIQDKSRVLEKLKISHPTVPTTIKEQLRTNPFLRCDKKNIFTYFGLEKKDEILVFKKLRELKDNF